MNRYSLLVHRTCFIVRRFISQPTVQMISTARFSVGKLLLHHYKSDLALISVKYSSVIELYLSETRANNNNK